jgi:MFS superfamily sulfate permease-like transporter
MKGSFGSNHGFEGRPIDHPLDERLIYDPDENLFFVNFEGYTVRTSEDVQKEGIKAAKSIVMIPEKDI